MEGIGPLVARATQAAIDARETAASWALLQNWFIQFVIVAVLVWITIKVIARVYSGDVQNTPLGPIALRAHDGEPGERTQRIWAPRATLPPSMNGLHAYCKFLYAYDDADGERQYVELSADPKDHRVRRRWRRQFLFEIRDRRFGKAGDEATGREPVDDVSTRDVLLHNPDLHQEGVPLTGAATPENVADWISAQAPRDFQTTGTEIVSVPEGLRTTLISARERYIQKMARRAARHRGAFIKLGDGARNRPGVMGYYYMKVSFDTSAWFVLFHHPDRDLKMTAWLTVLTSFFGFMMGKLP